MSDADIARIHAPIGLDIGAVSPAEIAVAIMGEITARLRQAAETRRRHEVRRRSRRDEARGRHRGALHPQGRARAQEGHADRRQPRSPRCKAAGIAEIVVARLEPGDVSEDEAAAEIAAAVAGEGVRVDRAFTGRCNLFAEARRRAGGRQGRDRPRSTASTRRSRSRRCRPSSRWSQAR